MMEKEKPTQPRGHKDKRREKRRQMLEYRSQLLNSGTRVVWRGQRVGGFSSVDNSYSFRPAI